MAIAWKAWPRGPQSVHAPICRAARVPVDSPVWEPVTHALGQLLHIILLTTAPQRILMGGGVVVSRPELLSRIRAQFVKSLNGYLDLDDLTGGVDRYVVTPGLGALAGPLGALALAADAASVANKRAGC